MTGKYQPYSAYKDSGVVWLGNVPVHWSTSKIGYLSCKTGSGKTPKGGSEVYSDDGVLFLRSQNIYDFGLKIDKNDVVFISENIDAEMSSSRVFAGDILLNITGASIGRTCIVPNDFQRANVNQHVCIIRVPLALQEYVALCLKSTATKAQIDAAQNGAAREGLNFEQLSKIEIALPENKAEQEQIANFLDHETAKIDTLIAKQEKLIELLQEKRQAVISHAVTKGLDPDVPMKDSGVEWLGEVPAHWEIKNFGHISCVVRGGSPRPAGDPTLFNGDYSPWVTVAEITKDNNVYLTKTESFLTKKGCEQCRVFSSGTLLISNSGATLGVPKILKINANANDGVVGFEKLLINHEFAYFYISTITNDLRNRIKQGSGQPNLNTDIIKKIAVPIPPAPETLKIVADLNKKVHKFKQIESKAQEGIKLLRERRTALISAAVTGKIDVRNWKPSETQVA